MRETTARDIMSQDVVTLSSEMTLADAASRFQEKGISGAPVVSENNTLLGVLSQTDLLHEASELDLDDYTKRSFYMAMPFSDDGAFISAPDRFSTIPVSQVMKRDVLSVQPSDSASSVASLMRSNKVHRVIVCEGEKVVGLISSFDLLALLEQH